MKTAIVFLLSALVAIPALAGPPLNGSYKSTDLGGSMLMGRYSEKWYPSPMSIHNTTNQESWNGATLGTQWQWHCPWLLAAPVLLYNGVDGSGNGSKIWQSTYSGGLCVLYDGGPWSNGDASYLAQVNTWTEIVTETYASFAVIGTIRNANVTGSFVGYNETCASLHISNAERLGNTVDDGPLATNYPNFWDYLACTDVGGTGPGEWGEITAITFTISGCEPVPTLKETWGAIKQRYRD